MGRGNMTGWRLVCDVGGTNIRVGRSDRPGHIADVNVKETRNCSSLSDALVAYSQTFGDGDRCHGVAIAAAGRVESGRVTLTNAALTIEARALTVALDGMPVTLLNDLEAAAYALPLLRADDINPLVETSGVPAGPRLVVNVGTGFGAALLVRTSSGWQSVATEAGHMTFAAIDRDGRLTINAETPVCIEDRISGLAMPPGQPFAAKQFVEEFGEALGTVSGNLVLATGAWGGVYFCGSVVSAWLAAGRMSSFIYAFQNKGRMFDAMARVPVQEIRMPHPALIGLTAIELK
jgi:glucokinase